MLTTDQISRSLFSRLVEREDNEIATLNDLYRAALEQTIQRMTGDLERDEKGRLIVDPSALVRIRRGFDRLGNQASTLLLEQHTERVLAALDRHVEFLSEGWEAVGEDPIVNDELVLTELVRAGYLDRFDGLSRYHYAQLRDAVTRHVLARSTSSKLRAEMRMLSGRSAREADRLHHDVLIGFSRSVLDESSNSRGYLHFEYRGPEDSVNRPFCRRHLGKVYTRTEIGRLDNGQTGNVMLTCGGFRCRHHWRPVKKKWFDAEAWIEKRA